MSQILTFLGKGGTGRSTLAVVAARMAAQQGRRVLLVGDQSGHSLDLLLEVSLGPDPIVVAANLSAVQLRSTVLLERSWAQAKELEAQYLRNAFFKDIYPQELAVLPGMDQALALDALRRFDASNDYDCIIYDGSGNLDMLRSLGIPEVASWYWRRGSRAFLDSDLAKSLRPFAEPLLRAVSTVDVPSLDQLPNQLGGERNFLAEGREALADPLRVLAHVVTTPDPLAIKTAKFLWGSAQMIGLTVGSVLVTPLSDGSVDPSVFAPLSLRQIPRLSGDLAALEAALSGLFAKPEVPKPVDVDEGSRTVKLFIPGFGKQQIELSQSGPELTITAGDQRRNLSLPPSLAGRQVSGAKFQEPFLVISFA